jgi:hypothetical protein
MHHHKLQLLRLLLLPLILQRVVLPSVDPTTNLTTLCNCLNCCCCCCHLSCSVLCC